ncbi:MAG: HNH endonuclease [Deltaproteobacteria bacterium]|nr:HNH endonuclease [Deltaproteobacteria bacterium]
MKRKYKKRASKYPSETCAVDGCVNARVKRAWCATHYDRWRKYGDPTVRVLRKAGEGTPHNRGYWHRQTGGRGGRQILAHVEIVEKVLGKRLPPGAIVHHVDGNKMNNAHSNLVVCQDQAFHNLLHSRSKAKKECGDANYLRCEYCGRWDPPGSIVRGRPSGYTGYHKECRIEYRRKRRALGLSA